MSGRTAGLQARSCHRIDDEDAGLAARGPMTLDRNLV